MFAGRINNGNRAPNAFVCALFIREGLYTGKEGRMKLAQCEVLG